MRKSGVSDEKLLDEYSTTRLEVYDQQIAKKREELDLETRLNEAKALGNKAEEERLRWLQQYNKLQSEGYSEDEARRSANAQSASRNGKDADSTNYVRPGEMVPGTNRRRGANESDAMGENALNLAPGQSLLDQYKQTQNRAVGSVDGKSILPDDPTSSVDAGGNATAGKDGKGGADDAAKKLADTLKKELDGVKKALDDAKKNTDNAKLLSAVTSLGEAIKTADAKLQSQIDNLASQIG